LAAYVIAPPDLDKLDTGLLYLAISLDKPIVMVILPGCKISDKLAKVVDRFVEITPGMTAGQMMESVKAALIELGIVPYTSPVQGYDIKPSHN
jgi:hypothetical protein